MDGVDIVVVGSGDAKNGGWKWHCVGYLAKWNWYDASVAMTRKPDWPTGQLVSEEGCGVEVVFAVGSQPSEYCL